MSESDSMSWERGWSWSGSELKWRDWKLIGIPFWSNKAIMDVIWWWASWTLAWQSSTASFKVARRLLHSVTLSLAVSSSARRVSRAAQARASASWGSKEVQLKPFWAARIRTFSSFSCSRHCSSSALALERELWWSLRCLCDLNSSAVNRSVWSWIREWNYRSDHNY